MFSSPILSDYPIFNIQAFDAVFFIGANEHGYYFTLGSERRPMGVVNGLFYLVVSVFNKCL